MGASVLFKELDRILSATPSLHEIRNALEIISPDLRGGSVEICGWLLEPEPQAFQWASDSPGVFTLRTHAVIGSGASEFSHFLRPDGCRQMAPTLAEKGSEFGALYCAGRLMAYELLGEQKSFGIAYDMLVADGNSFRAVGPIVYHGLTVQLNETFDIVDAVAWGIVRHWNVGEFTIVQKTHPGGVQIDCIWPIFETPHARLAKRLQRAMRGVRHIRNFNGKVLSLFVDVRLADGTEMPPVVVRFMADNPLWVIRDKTGVAVNMNAIKDTAKAVAAAHYNSQS